MFYTKGGTSNGHNDVNYEVVLRNCNGKLTQWMDTWQAEMQRGRSHLPAPQLHTELFSSWWRIISFFLPQPIPSTCPAVLEQLRDPGLLVPSSS